MIGERLAFIHRQLASISDTASLDAQGLLAHILQKPRAWVLAHPEAPLTPEQEQALQQRILRLQEGEPLPYVLGEWEFYGLPFLVTPAVLIPRPETELLVDHALQWLKTSSSLRAATRGTRGQRSNLILSKSDSDANQESLCASLNHPFAIDIGTGSGCIAVALASRLPGVRIIASDISFAALEVARQNISRHHLAAQVRPLQSNLLTAFAAQPVFDLVCANLPYIPQESLPGLPVSRGEPALALDGGPHGLALIEPLLHQAVSRLAPGGLLLLEIEASQGQSVPELARQVFPSAIVSLHRDLAGRDRLVSILLPQ